MLQKKSSYARTMILKLKCMCFLIEDDDLLKIFNDIWYEVSNSVKKQLGCERIYNKKILKLK